MGKLYIYKMKKHIQERGIYGIVYALKRFIQHTLFYKYIILYKVKMNAKRENETLDNNLIGVFDTSIGTYNIGDYIIMDYCAKQLKDIFPNQNFYNMSTHIEPTREQCKKMLTTTQKFVCGTNLLWGEMEKYHEWMLPVDVDCYKDMCLMGVGWQVYNKKITKYSKMFYTVLLNSNYIHSVRDGYTKQKLNEMGIYNVINTSCPTMWELTPEFCLNIPQEKAEYVVTTVTDYRKDANNDKLMLEILKRNYKKVYIWLQGSGDEKYLEEIIDVDEYELIEGSLQEYDYILDNTQSIDYVGTRLHAGIRALNKKVRSIVVVVDNRAREISKDTNLVVIERNDIHIKLEKMINSSFQTQIEIPMDNIIKWKQQFK